MGVSHLPEVPPEVRKACRLLLDWVPVGPGALPDESEAYDLLARAAERCGCVAEVTRMVGGDRGRAFREVHVVLYEGAQELPRDQDLVGEVGDHVLLEKSVPDESLVRDALLECVSVLVRRFPGRFVEAGA